MRARMISALALAGAALAAACERQAPPPSPAATSATIESAEVPPQSENKNIALYDELLNGELPPDVRCVFSHLRGASRERHLPALERCAGITR